MSRLFSATQSAPRNELRSLPSHAIGIDFGGTNTKIGVVDKAGRVLAHRYFATRAARMPEDFARRTAKEIAALWGDAGLPPSAVGGAGIGIPGLVDHLEGVVHTLVNVPGWDGVRAADLLRKHLGMPVHIDNDVNAMALGELRFGAAKGCCNVVCLTLGTGVGGGIIIEGNLYHGTSLTAGEIGHIVVDRDGPSCNCGNKGCLEALIGAKALVRRARMYLKGAKSGVLAQWVRSKMELTPRLLAKAADKGDKIALRVWNEAAEYLGIVLAGVVNLLNPDVIVVGGGISEVGDFFLRKVRSVVHARAMSVPARDVKIVRTGLGNLAGVVGAASLVFQLGDTRA